VRELEKSDVLNDPETEVLKKRDQKARDKCKIEKLVIDHERKIVSLT